MDSNGSIVSYRAGEGSYFPRYGVEASMGLVMATVQGALKDASISADDLGVVVAGVSGIDFNGDELLIHNALKDRFAHQDIVACNDCEIAFYSGTTKFVGAVLCAGTGSNAGFFAPDGRKFVMSDYIKQSLQGGSAIAVRAIEAVFESEIGMWPETGLTGAFLDFAGAGSVGELLKRYMKEEGFSTRTKYMVPQILELAQSGDTVARVVLSAFADDLCACFSAAMDKMGMLELDCDIVLAGSVFTGRANILTGMVTERLSRYAENANIISARFEPVIGACIMGLRKKRGDYDEQAALNTAISAIKLGLTRAV